MKTFSFILFVMYQQFSFEDSSHSTPTDFNSDVWGSGKVMLGSHGFVIFTYLEETTNIHLHIVDSDIDENAIVNDPRWDSITLCSLQNESGNLSIYSMNPEGEGKFNIQPGYYHVYICGENLRKFSINSDGYKVSEEVYHFFLFRKNDILENYAKYIKVFSE